MDDVAPAPPLSEPPARDWSLLPIDMVCMIFVKAGAVDVLMGAGLVCHSWLEAAKLPEVWRVVDMENHEAVLLKDQTVLRAMARAAVHRSNGQLRVFAGKLFVNHKLMKFIVDRLTAVLESCPLLEVLRVRNCFKIYDDEDKAHTLQAKFPAIKILTLECDDEFRFSRKRNQSSYGYDDERFDYVPDFEDLRIE
ncbi:hypothetical protein CFC21_074411 [Triticum aestivum]|uniref:F-box domain-containing protein n=2 Tax=Triticum aestivum TaxID=4565 RepID=A0A3B6LW52_WHEAT|nr:hypothetical protein CFC21_074411 [Triticum aestivum]